MRSLRVFTFYALLFSITPGVGSAQSAWDAIDGPGAIYLGSMEATASGTLLAWQRYGGLLRSSDQGRSWSALLRNSYSGWQTPILTQGNMAYTVVPGKLLRSTDDGVSWDNIPGPGAFTLRSLSPEGHVVVSLGDTLHVSTNAGNDWNACTLAREVTEGEYIRTLACTEAGWFLAYNKCGVYRSTDMGASWEHVLPFSFQYSNYKLFYGDDDVLILAERDSLHSSTDDGVSWTKSPAPRTWPHRVYRLADGDLLLLDHSELFRSDDNGRSWTKVPISTVITDLRTFAILADGDFLIQPGTQLLRSSDGGSTWDEVILQRLYYSGANVELQQVADSVIICWAGGDMYRSADYGLSWARPVYNNCRNAQKLLFETRDRTLFSTAFAGESSKPADIISSIDGGATWTKAGEGPHASFSYLYGVPPFAESAEALLVFDCNGGIARSSDDGATWETFGEWDESMDGRYVKHVIGLQPPHADILLAATGARGLKRSIDGGANWQAVDPGGSTSQPYCSQVFETRHGDAFLVTWDEIFRSTDQGATWELMNTAVFPEHIGTVVTDIYDHLYEYQPERNTPDALWLMESTDRGEHWRKVALPQLPVPTEEIADISFDGKNRMIIVTEFDGLFRLDASLTDVRRNPVLPSTADITAMYPQPLHSGTAQEVTVGVSMPVSGTAQLRLYDLLGRQLHSTMNIDLGPGHHRLQIPTVGLRSGTHVLQLHSEGSTVTRLLTILP